MEKKKKNNLRSEGERSKTMDELWKDWGDMGAKLN